MDIRTIYALQGSGGTAAPSVPPAATGPAAPVPLFVLSGVSCSSDPRETGSGGRVTCSATTVNRPAAGDPAVYVWRLDGRPVGGTGAVMTADGVPNGRHVITAVAANGGSRTPPFEVEVTVTGSPAAQPSSPPPLTVDVGGGTAPLPQNRPVKLQLTPEVRAAIVRAQCGNLDYLVLMVDVYRSRQDVDRGMIENLEATLIRDIRACVAKGQLPTEVGAAAGANRRSLPGSSGVAGRVTLQMASGAVRLPGRQTEVEWAVETPAGVALASGMAVFAASYSPPSRSVLLEAQSGPVRFIPAAPGAQPVIIQPGQSLQWPPAVPAATSGFDGVWATTWGDWGKITMWVTGNRITGWWGGDGSQATAGGTLEGTIDGRTARLRWKDRGTLWGGAMFTLSDDGNTLTGHRNDFKDPEVAMYKWNAQRVSSGG
ncbi:MAG: hypothetical protein HY822_09125 [Acidobacteria bacterium]|nr:hypothetical protein [Acidobacteriota bacterium]